MGNMAENVVGKYTVQVLEDHIEHQQAVLQIRTMSENKMKLQEDLHHHRSSCEEAQIIWEPKQNIETRNKQLGNHVIIEYLIK